MSEGQREERENPDGRSEEAPVADGEVLLRPSVTLLTMSDGTSVTVPRGGVVVFVGPNNAGKSVSLRDIRSHLTTQHTPPLAVTDINVDKDGSDHDLVTWLEKHCHKTFQHGGDWYSRRGSAGSDKNSLIYYWNNGPPFGTLGEMLVFYATGAGRLNAAQGVSSIDFSREPPTAPLHYLFLDPELENKISEASVRAFGQPLVLDQYSGTMIYLRLGEAPSPQFEAGRPSREYQEALRALPALDEQGDGMKSFMGLALNILVSAYPYVLVDEPEAFLHPPQARLLGRLLADDKAPDAQVFVATHDSDVLTGLLDSSASDITIVRLVRDGNINRTSQLDPEKVKELWKDPILRYSNILDGLFHEAVVLCEGDADCRFYASVLDAIEHDENRARKPEFLFTHCGGKHRMPTVVEALRAVSVPVRVVADFDVLREKQPLKGIVENLGGNWSSVEADWSVVKAALDSSARAPSVGWVKEKVVELLDSITTPTLQRGDADKIRGLTRAETDWDKAKRSGKSAVPQGQPTERVERLLSNLREIGLFVVEVGEVERFAPSVGGHGPVWVNAVHEQGLHADGSLKEARDFVRSVTGLA